MINSSLAETMQILRNSVPYGTGDLVSIVIPAYNHEEYIEEAINSIWGQSYKNVEIIAVDDGSTDGTGAKLDKLLTASNMPMIVVRKSNEGICKSLNLGVNLSKGDLLCFLASDDKYSEGRIMDHVSFMRENEQLSFVYGDYVKMHNNGTVLNYVNCRAPSREDMFLSIINFHFSIYTQSMTIRRNAFIDIGGFDQSLSFEDLDFFLKLVKRYKAGYINKTSFCYRTCVTNSMTSNFMRYESDVKHIIAKYRQDAAVTKYGYSKVTSNYYKKFATKYYYSLDSKNFFRCVRSGLRANIGNSILLRLALSYVPYLLIQRFSNTSKS